ncbi:sugar phosphate isomerase/epimerase family protein [Clostridium sp. UBA6640]|uniref:sugar phosphate isomerase/epimerase family protein n=1 Tax=Clostridium sp. UBA6640 TaxID=1946370 RepID=UPI0025BA8A2C|nr:TIM barrel protein [Clostridium sp. UBA6640]
MIYYGRSIRWFNDYDKEVKFSIDNGFDFMQIWYMKGDILIDKIEGDKGNVIKEHGFPVIIHAVLDINEFEEHVPKILDILNYFSHKEVIIHPICESEEINSSTIFKLAEKISHANEAFLKAGITLYVENNSKLDPIFYKTEEINIMFSKNPNVELLLDIAHIDSYDHLKNIIQIKKPKILHIADKSFDAIHEHLPVGNGEIDFKYIFEKILKDFDGKIIFEVVDEDEVIINSKNIIKKIIEEN